MLRALNKLHVIANLVVVQCSQTRVVRRCVAVGVPISNETADAAL